MDPKRLVFLDESGIDTRMARAYARAAASQRAVGKVPWGHWKRLTVLGALALDGVVAGMSIAPGSPSGLPLGVGCRNRHGRVPGLRRAGADPGPAPATGCHRGHGQPGRAQGQGGPAGARPGRDQLPLSPALLSDLNPIEQAWSKLKAHLRTKAARSLEALEVELGPALDAITANDAQGWFRLAGYAAPN